VEQLARHARSLAAGHQIGAHPGTNQLLTRLDANERKLRAFNRAAQGGDPRCHLTPAAEWMLDNFYLIDEQIQMARRHLPRGYSRELPRLLDGPSAGLPRVFDMVLEMISHVDAQIEAGPLGAFIDSYQSVDTLKLGELWAIPIMLRLGLIENLQRIASRLDTAREDCEIAGMWVRRLQEMAETHPSKLVIVVADMAKSGPSLSSAFVAEFCLRLSQGSPLLQLARSWLEHVLIEQGLSIELLIHLDSQNQAADQVSVSHSICSLRFLGAMNWKEFVETLSVVETTLRSDPADVYSDMEFSTRDQYRHAVETIARDGNLTETEVALKSIHLAGIGAREHGLDDRSAHVGYYLIDKGLPVLEAATNVRRPWKSCIERWIHRWPLSFYGGGVALLTVLATLGFIAAALALAVDAWRILPFAMIFLLCASQLAVALMNWASGLLVRPILLPRLDFSMGIPADCRTMVVVPTMITSAEGVDRLIESLEIHHLANRDPNLYFALLTDFPDAAGEVLPGDDALLAQIRAGVEMLNRKYPAGLHTCFFLFHRPRRWNPVEGLWMGYERKRGKLMEFNSLLRGGSRACFTETAGDTGILPAIKYVITLDTDTQLPRDAARQLVGTMAHPLNRPRFDTARGVVTEGYGILQPRVGVSLPSSRRSWFVRLFAGDAGIDPYTREVSDIYQDVFHEGSFIGKGIYDVDAFESALNGRFPENAILSHDLLESCHVRSALVSDVELYEKHPSRYDVDIDRRHRWIRGDWQITQWLLPRVPGPDARRIANPLSALSLWKIFDNLRRSLVPIGLILFILGSWFFLPGVGAYGALLIAAIITLPAFLASLVDALRKPHDQPWRMHLRGVTGSAGRHLGQISLTFAFLPYDAFISLDAITRTLARLLVTRKHLLEWRTSSDAEHACRIDLRGFHTTMWIAPAVALVTGSLLFVWQPAHLPMALPILLLWLMAPSIAWWISLPIRTGVPDLTATQRQFLRLTSRKTWHYFETFVTSTDHWLPPDNYQEIPVPTIAMRTSPTNMGLALLANLAALDSGYVTMEGMIRRTRDTLDTMQGLKRYRGHFYNWYDTRTLEPLPPLYISSVDSGNLAGHLLILASGLREQLHTPTFTPQIFAGLQDTVRVLREFDQGNTGLAAMEAELDHAPSSPRAAAGLLEILSKNAAGIAATPANGVWLRLLQTTCEGQLKELLALSPWLALPCPKSPLLREKLARMEQPFSLAELAMLQETQLPAIETELNDITPGPQQQTLLSIARCLREASGRASLRLGELEQLAQQSDDLAAMDFSFLYNPAKDLFSIGFSVTESRCDLSYYDLLASEARLCSYVAIALGQVPQNHWFALGRQLIGSHHVSLLASWSGSMFEYLMPLLVMPNFENTLLDQTYRAAVNQQIEHGKSNAVPWGVSESGFNRRDALLNYQYHAFGVPGLGLKRGLDDDLVIAPYASAMALMVVPREACANLELLASQGRSGDYGFYEAVDFTPSRLPPDRSSVTIRSFMAHHQGMSLLAIGNVLLGNPMHRRFLACPMLNAADLLLHERVPRATARLLTDPPARETSQEAIDEPQKVMRIFTNPSRESPDVHLLSNGRYHVAISSAGGGYSRWQDLAVTRWREDATRDCWGTFVYLRDLATGGFWSTAFQPTLQATQGYEAIFTQSRAEFRNAHADLDIHTEISVSPEDDVELRRITIHNRSTERREIELTSYAEVVLSTHAADEAHPAFSNLFVQTEFIPAASAILCARRARSETEKPPWLLHLMISDQEDAGDVSCETDRSRFVGRGGSLANPAAMQSRSPLSNTVGSVLDPIVSLRRTVTLPAHGSAVINLVLGVTENRSTALAHVEKYQSLQMTERAFDMAWTHNQVTLYHLDITETEAQLYGMMAGALIYAVPARRANPGLLLHNRRGRTGLWSYGISGDLPIILIRISDVEKIELVRQLIRAHSFWRTKGLTVDLVILHEDVSVYRQSLENRIFGLISSGREAQMLDKPGGIFVRSLDQIPDEDRILLQATARIVLDDEKGTLAEQLAHRGVFEPVIPALKPTRLETDGPPPPLPQRSLIFENGYGGFTRDGHEYVITLRPGQTTPAPWVNVIANPHFGTVVSESGSAYTWAENAHEFRLTPWNNDPVRDATGEALYIRDEQSGRYWSPTPLPARGKTPYVTRHGFGYTVFEHAEAGIISELWVYVAMDASVKFMVLKLKNVSGRPRRLSVTGFWEWVLGELRQKSLLHVRTEVDLNTGALLVRNLDNTEFPNRIVFIDTNDASRTVTGDRKEFIGRNGTLAQPSALKREHLSGRVGAGLDPCGAIQVTFDLADGQERETTFRLGVGRGQQDVRNLIHRFRAADAASGALKGVWAYWNQTLGAVNVDTPDPAVNVMANGWLLYQTLSCRLWGRTGFYQSGGAYGFRDQLQDSMALVHAQPALTREHLLRAAARQFKEGDVQHWWHPPAGRGVRTHFSDDYLWLPYVTCHYVKTVADTGILDERIPFLEARAVKPDEEAYYDLPNHAEEAGTLYQHCVRSIKNGLNFGKHGLPLMGCGDWNDGMNLVGKEGRGESVWLAFFLYDVLTRFAPLARARDDHEFAGQCLAQARELQRNIEENAWDGEWYRRAYFDNGEPLGSHLNTECQIDSLPQSWSVISGAGDPSRSRQAMESVDRRLVRRNARLIQLFDPPFDKSSLNPGYIKAYIPGVRENGGQYTHAAIWSAMAFAAMGDHERAWKLFSLLNPVHHGGSSDQIATYKVEPYVVAADVYAVEPHTGRGGWTWYTGSASWMYRLLIDTLLGVNLEGDKLRLDPRLPESWESYKIHYRYRQTVYHITIARGLDAPTVTSVLTLDGREITGSILPLQDDQREHHAELKIHSKRRVSPHGETPAAVPP
jgi:cellobiose phosphorylase